MRDPGPDKKGHGDSPQVEEMLAILAGYWPLDVYLKSFSTINNRSYFN
jgi:hypothetical protein